ncbi:MAG TPA: hypothetical protein VJJ83_04545, partial [Candidatus Babeliales bacterium]|nr:hypothetical protein [Candidatus Babeliales bacterium]
GTCPTTSATTYNTPTMSYLTTTPQPCSVSQNDSCSTSLCCVSAALAAKALPPIDCAVSACCIGDDHTTTSNITEAGINTAIANAVPPPINPSSNAPVPGFGLAALINDLNNVVAICPEDVVLAATADDPCHSTQVAQLLYKYEVFCQLGPNNSFITCPAPT